MDYVKFSEKLTKVNKKLKKCNTLQHFATLLYATFFKKYDTIPDRIGRKCIKNVLKILGIEYLNYSYCSLMSYKSRKTARERKT